MLHAIAQMFARPLGGWGLLATGLAFRALYQEPRDVRLSHHRIRTDKLREEIRIAHLTDLHIDHDRRRDNVPGLVNDQKPDLIVMTGDYLNKMTAFPRLADFVRRFESRYGVFASFGNWDRGLEDFLFRDGKVIPLRDSILKMSIGQGNVSLAGIDFHSANKARSILGPLNRECFNILLHHTPDLIEEIAGYGTVDLYFAGHTHGGQVCVPFLKGIRDGFQGRFPYAGAVIALSKFGTKYESGRFEVGDTTLYVNRGVGMEGGLAPRIRLFCPPEIAVFDIVPSQ